MTTTGVVLSISEHDPERQRAHGHFVSFVDGEKVRLRPWAVRYAPPAELDAMAAAAGMAVDERWEDFERHPFLDTSSRHVTVYALAGSTWLSRPEPAAFVYPESTVSQLRLNPLTGRWVTIVAERAKRPTDFVPRAPEVDAGPGRACPFCPGHDDPDLVPVETVENGGGWRMRVLPNRYPAFDGHAGFVVHHLGPVHVTAEASGVHEVFVYTPNHDGGLHELDDAGAAELMGVIQRRLAAHAAAPEIRYTQVIINHGREAGAVARPPPCPDSWVAVRAR